MRAIDNWKILKDKHSLAASAEDLLARKSEIYRELVREGFQTQPGLIELIANLRQVPVKKAVASSSLRHDIGLVIANLGLETYFEAIVSGEGVKAAKAAGMKVIAVPNRYTRDHDFDTADLVVNSLEELNWDKISRL